MRKLLFCLCFLCFPWLWLRAQQRIAFARLPPFERAVVYVKFFERFHGKSCYPYVGYGHQLQKGEHFFFEYARMASGLFATRSELKH